MKSLKALREEKRAEYLKSLVKALTDLGEDVGCTGANELNMPIVLADGTEDFLVVKLSIPTGSRDGEAYDGYGAREDYTLKQAQTAQKRAEAAVKKQKKIERDEKMRASKAANKAKKEQA